MRKALLCILLIVSMQTIFLAKIPIQAQIDGELSINLTAELQMYEAADALAFRFTITNHTDNTLSVLKWNTPFEGFNSDMFFIERDGEKVVYLGRTVKRGPIQPDDYMTIGPRESKSTVIKLGNAYAIQEEGNYSIQFRSDVLDVGKAVPLAAKREFVSREITSNSVTFRIIEKRAVPPTPKLAPEFNKCSQSQRSTINNALTEAETMALNSKSVLDNTLKNNRENATRYVTWFGQYENSRYDTVMNHFEKIADALANKKLTFNCDCSENYYAYVYPSKPYEIFLCTVFWTVNPTGTDSQAGTIIHETSHFKVVAGTFDHGYGTTNCKNIAKNDPSNAIENADSHEYFAENDPPLSMGMTLTVPIPNNFSIKKNLDN